MPISVVKLKVEGVRTRCESGFQLEGHTSPGDATCRVHRKGIAIDDNFVCDRFIAILVDTGDIIGEFGCILADFRFNTSLLESWRVIFRGYFPRLCDDGRLLNRKYGIL